MTSEQVGQRARVICSEELPLPGRGNTAARHMRLFDIGLEDLSLAKIAEAHWDAHAILAEAGRRPEPGALYAVWASEIPGAALTLTDNRLSGRKPFCTGAGLVDRALVTVGAGDDRLLDVDLRSGGVEDEPGAWHTRAFEATHTQAIRFTGLRVQDDAVVGEPGFYLSRPGFWHGACGPASCWGGGAGGLLAYAAQNRRDDAHTLAHFAAMHANVWALRSLLRTAGEEIDRDPQGAYEAHKRALSFRHLVEALATDTLRRFARAYGPYPLSMDEETARRYQELDLFLRQSHGERDLEALGQLFKKR